MGKAPDDVLMYLNNDSWTAFDSSIGWAVNLWKPSNTPVIWSVPLTVTGTSLEQVATGAYNSHFLQAAQALAQSKPSSDGNIYVRVGWEFNASWMPWAAAGHESAFIQSFQNLVNTFRSVSGQFKFVWDTTNDGGNMNPEAAYPGDKYVDVIGTDVYYDVQWDGTDAAKAFQGEVTRPYGLQWQQDFAAAHGKATAISEWGVASDNAGPYIQAMTKWMADHHMVYENYWDSNASYSGQIDSGQYPTAAGVYQSAIDSLQSPAVSSTPGAPLVTITSPGGLTNALAVNLVGTVDLSNAGTTVHVLDGTTEIGTATVQADGKWSAIVTLLNQQGTHQITVSDANAVGTGISNSVSYTVDTVAPLLSASESVSGLTNKTSDTLTVTTSDGTSGVRSVEIYDNGHDLGAATQSSNGSWAFTAAALADGTHNFTAVAIDNASNTSGPVSAGNSVVVDTHAPIIRITDSVRSVSGTATTTIVSGHTEAGSKVTLYDNGSVLTKSIVADGSGDWSFASTGLSTKTVHTFTATAVDAAGNLSATSNELLIGTTGNDRISDRSAGAVFVSSGGSDILSGGGGGDTFVFHTNFGKDTITNFVPDSAWGSAHDVLAFDHAVTGLGVGATDADLAGFILNHAKDTSGGALITIDSSNTILMQHVMKAELTLADFHLI